jgi:TM2 domain-containing membrane protein YozV
MEKLMALVICAVCGKEVSDTARRCPNCGFSSSTFSGSKSKGLAIVLALFLGGLGIHKFYLGKIGLGFLYLIFCWTFIPAILGVIDAIILATRNEREFSGAVQPGIASNLAVNQNGEALPFYKQPALYAVAIGIILLIFAIGFGTNQS